MKSKTVTIPEKTITFYNWYDIQDEICKVMGIAKEKFRDLKGRHGHFHIWCDAKGYGYKDPEGKDRGSSQIWFKEYNQDPNGDAACPEYCDLWHFALDIVIPDDMHNDSIVTMYPLEDYDDDPDYYDKGVDWKRAFCKAYNQVMLKLDPECDGIKVEFSW